VIGEESARNIGDEVSMLPPRQRMNIEHSTSNIEC